MAKYIRTEKLTKLNDAAITNMYKQQLLPKVFLKLREKAMHFVHSHKVLKKGKGGVVRTTLYVKLRGQTEPVSATLDMQTKDYEALHRIDNVTKVVQEMTK